MVSVQCGRNTNSYNLILTLPSFASQSVTEKLVSDSGDCSI